MGKGQTKTDSPEAASATPRNPSPIQGRTRPRVSDTLQPAAVAASSFPYLISCCPYASGLLILFFITYLACIVVCKTQKSRSRQRHVKTALCCSYMQLIYFGFPRSGFRATGYAQSDLRNNVPDNLWLFDMIRLNSLHISALGGSTPFGGRGHIA